MSFTTHIAMFSRNPFVLFIYVLACLKLGYGQNSPCTLSGVRPTDYLFVSENTKIGTVIDTIPFTADNSTISLSATNASSYFIFNVSSNSIVVTADIDAEKKIDTQNVNIFCKDLSSQREVPYYRYLIITDVNDNPPIFTSNVYHLSVKETTALNTKLTSPVNATDMDISFDNKRIVFSILEGTYRPYFSIFDPTKTDLSLLKKLDYETLPQLNLTVMASDGIFNTTCTLTIDVVDEDDQNPVFNASMYRGTIKSDAVANSTVPINPPIFAFDPDVTLHVPVVYSFHGSEYHYAQGRLFFTSDSGVQTTPVLDIDPQTGVVKMLEKPTGDEIYVLVQATQTDNPSRYGVALLAVTIQGNNISAPVFTKSAYNVVVTEVFPKGEVVTSVLATDSQGSPLIYYLSDPDGYFSIDPYSGDIILAQEFGIKRQFVLTVTASSGKLNSTATVTINVLPLILNQNPPRILNSVLNVTSERKKGNVLIVINASDPDEGTELSYRLLNFNNLFTINKTGAITIIAEPGDLVYSSYTITVVVSDGGQPSYETAAAVNVIFPSAVVPVAAAQIEMDTTLVIILGVLAAIFLICVVILVVYICKRRLKDKEHLDREKKARPSQQATPLAYKQKQGALGPQAMDNIFLENSDGDSGNQDNPLNGVSKGSYFNFVQDDHDTEADIHDSDIQVETSVLPFDNSALYIHSEGNDNTDNNSSIYSDYSYQPNNKNSLSPFYRNGSLSTFRGSTDSDISNTGVPSESANSKKMLLPGSLARTKLPEESGEIWERSDPSLGAIYVNDNLDADASVVPTAQKQELTVYF